MGSLLLYSGTFARSYLVSRQVSDAVRKTSHCSSVKHAQKCQSTFFPCCNVQRSVTEKGRVLHCADATAGQTLGKGEHFPTVGGVREKNNWGPGWGPDRANLSAWTGLDSLAQVAQLLMFQFPFYVWNSMQKQRPRGKRK